MTSSWYTGNDTWRLSWIALWNRSIEKPSEAIWGHRFWSSMAQKMACCLMAQSHYLSKGWLIANETLRNMYEGHFNKCMKDTCHKMISIVYKIKKKMSRGWIKYKDDVLLVFEFPQTPPVCTCWEFGTPSVDVIRICCCPISPTEIQIPSNLLYKVHQSKKLNTFPLILQLSLPDSLKPGVKLRRKM